MDANLEKRQYKQPTGQQPYIGDDALRTLARMIARDILHRAASFNTAPDVAKSVPQQKGSDKEKENEPSS